MTLQGYERRLSERDRKRIARTLHPLRDGVNRAVVLAEIESATQRYWADAENEESGQISPWGYFYSETWREFQHIANCATNILETIDSLGAHREDKLQDLLQRAHMCETTYPSLLEVKKQIGYLRSAAKSFRPRGRRRSHLLLEYATHLALIYADATGARPRRVYNKSRLHQGEAEHLPFFAACMAAANVKYCPFIIRRALEFIAHLERCQQCPGALEEAMKKHIEQCHSAPGVGADMPNRRPVQNG